MASDEIRDADDAWILPSSSRAWQLLGGEAAFFIGCVLLAITIAAGGNMFGILGLTFAIGGAFVLLLAYREVRIESAKRGSEFDGSRRARASWADSGDFLTSAQLFSRRTHRLAASMIGAPQELGVLIAACALAIGPTLVVGAAVIAFFVRL
jgi:hypothetical protein